jgi:hypothetical protein
LVCPAEGECWDNAVTETPFGSLKGQAVARDALCDMPSGKRLHSTLGYLSPMVFEEKRLAY